MFPRRVQPKSLRVACSMMLLISVGHLARGQNNPAAGTGLARIEKSIEQGRLDEAEKPLLDYAVAHPRDARALYLLGEVRVRQGRLEEARALFRRVLALDPTLVRAKIILGQIMYESGERDEARRLLAGIASTRSAEPSVQLALSHALVMVGEYGSALATVEKLPVKVKNMEALPVMAASYLALGERQKLAAMLPSMRRAGAAKPFVAVQCAEILQNAGMSRQAIDLLRLTLATAPKNTGALVLLGRLETGAQQFAEARRHLDRAATLEPRSADVLAAQAALESAQGNSAAALARLEQARALAQDSPQILSRLVVAAMRANQAQAAVDGATALLKLTPNEPEALYLFGAASLQNGHLAAARNALERFIRQRPDDPRGCLALGIALAGQHEQSEAAKSQFERCIQLDPASVEAKYQLGLVFKSQGETEKSIQLLEDVTTRAPQHANAWRDLGALYSQTGADPQACAALERAAALNPQDAETHFQLSRLYNRSGDAALAERHLGLFQKLKSRNEKGSAQ